MAENSEKENVKIAGAIGYSVAEQKITETVVPQPRQPKTMQGLLNFAMEATKAEDAPGETTFGPIDEERKQFLEEALSSMSVNVIEVLQKNIEILQGVQNILENEDISRYMIAFDNILEYVDDIDTANNFFKIDGFSIFNTCLKCVRPEIRSEACNLLAELSQNNPFTQRVVLDGGYLPVLVKILNDDTNSQVRVKALYAISCIVRHNKAAFRQFISCEGFSVLLQTIQSANEKLRTKTAFLLTTLCNTETDVKSRLVFLDFIPAILNQIKTSVDKPVEESLLSLLDILVQSSVEALNECKEPKYDLEATLFKLIEKIGDDQTYMREKLFCESLLQKIFQPNDLSL